MKYVIIIADGAADHPLEELGGRTPLEVAQKPHTDQISLTGRQGTVATTPPGMACGSDVCVMSLLGYDPRKYHRGRAPLEAAALGIDLAPSDWVFRVNLVTVLDGQMQDHSAGHIRTDEGRRLLEDFAKRMDIPGMSLYPGVSYRNIMVDTSGRQGGGRDWSELHTTPPHDIPGEPIRSHLPVGGPHADLLQRMIAESQAVFAEHEINITRRDLGELPATHIWPWGQGRRPDMPSFESRYHIKGAMITAVDLLAGISAFIGFDRLEVPGQTSYHDTDYAAAGRAAIEALEKYDLVVVHIEAPDEAAHAADAATKVAAIEAIDKYVVGPLLDAVPRYADAGASEGVSGGASGGAPESGSRGNSGGGWRVLYLPDHYTCVGNRKHDPTPPPFALCGTKVHGVVARAFSEKNAADSDLHVKFGHELMEFFLASGL